MPNHRNVNPDYIHQHRIGLSARTISLAAAALLLCCNGCAHRHLTPVSSHTLRVAENKDADVVWVQYDKEFLRCENTAQGPICTSAHNR